MNRDDDQARDLAAGIVAWEEDLEPGWLEVAGVPVPVVAGHVLAEGALRGMRLDD